MENRSTHQKNEFLRSVSKDYVVPTPPIAAIDKVSKFCLTDYENPFKDNKEVMQKRENNKI